MNWKILSSEYLFKETWFTIRKDTCEAPDGRIISPYYVYEFPTWVTVVALTLENEVIMVRQYRHAIQQTILEVPGGCVDDTDADLQAAASRELLEETGYACQEFVYLGKISPNPSTNTNWMHMFLATGGKRIQEPELDFNEEIEVELISIEELKMLLRENKIVQSLHASTITYALQHMGELII